MILRVLFGGFWLYLGIEKLLRINDFIGDVENYQILHDSMAAGVAYVVVAMEIVVGVSILTRLAYRGGLMAVAVILIIFTAALGRAWSQGLEISCGCTPWAAQEQTNYTLGIGFNLSLLLFTALLFYVELKRPRHRFRGNKLKLST